MYFSDAGGRRRRYRARGLQSNAQGMKINEAPLVKRDINQAHFGDEEELDFVNEEWDFTSFKNLFKKSKINQNDSETN